MINKTTSMEGYLVGIGIEHADGTRDFKWLDKPVHNTIVDSGIEHMLRFGGDNNKLLACCPHSVNPFLRYGTKYGNSTFTSDNVINEHHGILTYMAIGTNGESTETTMTNLIAPIADSSNNIFSSSLMTGAPYCGTSVTDYGKYHIRITHNSIAVTETTVIKEFGLFGRTNLNNEIKYPMFCRINLPEELYLTLNAGEKAIFTYQLDYNLTVTGTNVTDNIPLNIKDTNGNDLGYFVEARAYTSSMNNGITTGTIPYASFYSKCSGIAYSPEGNQFEETNRPIGIYDSPSWFIHTNTVPNGNMSIYNSNTWYQFQELGWQNANSNFMSKNYYELYTFRSVNPKLEPLATNTSESWLYGEIMVEPYVDGSKERKYHIRIAQNGTWNPINLNYFCIKGVLYRLYKLVDGVKTYTPLNLYPGDIIQLDFKQSFIALNTKV